MPLTSIPRVAMHGNPAGKTERDVEKIRGAGIQVYRVELVLGRKAGSGQTTTVFLGIGLIYASKHEVSKT